MIKGDRLASTVKQDYAKAIQINHLNKSPSSIQTRLDPNFVQNIEAHKNPAAIYNRAMKELFMENLNDGVNQRADDWKLRRQQQRLANTDKRGQQNGVLCELQKNSLTYSLVLQSKLNQQQERKRKFIDQSKLKNERINNLIQAQQDKDVFNHQSDTYQKYQRAEHQHTMSMLQMQKQNKDQEHRRMQMVKERQFEQRMRYERELEIRRKWEKHERISNQIKYQGELTALVCQKNLKDSLDSVVMEGSIVKHNPITNPIEYHIQNPYILKSMQQRHTRMNPIF